MPTSQFGEVGYRRAVVAAMREAHFDPGACVMEENEAHVLTRWNYGSLTAPGLN
jgi:hypothetical protein